MKVITSIFCAAAMLGSLSPVYAQGIEFTLTYRSELFPEQDNTLDTSTLPEVGQQAFKDFCEGICVPATERVLTIPPLQKPVGKVYGWSKNLVIFPDFSGNCFESYYIFDLEEGQFYVRSRKGCITTFDPSNFAPTQGGDAIALVTVRGAEVIGGTGIYKNATGEANFSGYVEFFAVSFESAFGDIIYRLDNFKLNLDSDSSSDD